MLDIRLIRNDPAEVEKRLKTKDPSLSLKPILELDEGVRKLKLESEELKNRRNLLSKEIGEKKRQKLDAASLMGEVSEINEKIARYDQQLGEQEKKLNHLLASLPNLPDPSVKIAADPKENVVLRTFGEKPSFPFAMKHHVELNEQLHIFDFKRAVKCSGSHFVAYKGLGARLEWALINYMLDFHIENGFQFWMPPLMVRPEIVYGSAHLPKFEDQLFKIRDEDFHLYLLPTAEAVLMGLHFEEILKAEELPLKYVAYTPCFRREAGALGANERGLIRMHQFNKVEMFAFAKPDQSEAVFQEMVGYAEALLQGLNLHYRVTGLVTGDTSFAAEKTYDLEVWLPGQGQYREVSSISQCGTFQSRRSNTRFKEKEEKPEFVHTLNGSGLATSRLMVALLECNQRADGSIAIPLVLHKYLNGIKEMNPSK